MKPKSKSSTQPLPAELLTAARRVLDDEGATKAADRIGISVAALTRACAGAPVRRGTLAILRNGLHAGSGLGAT